MDPLTPPGPRLETARLRLEPLAPARLAQLHRHWTGPEVRRYLWDDREISRQEAEVQLRKSMELFRRHGYGLWAAVLQDQPRRDEGRRNESGQGGTWRDREDRAGYGRAAGGAGREGVDELVGVVGLLEVPEEAGEVEVIFSLEPAHQGRGLATEAAAAAVQHGFDLGLERILGRCDAPNEASRRVLERLGMEFFKREPIHGLDSLHYRLDKRSWMGHAAMNGPQRPLGEPSERPDGQPARRKPSH